MNNGAATAGAAHFLVALARLVAKRVGWLSRDARHGLRAKARADGPVGHRVEKRALLDSQGCLAKRARPVTLRDLVVLRHDAGHAACTPPAGSETFRRQAAVK
eukprot:scaffold3582_cov32-Tisochrysis_lutea.AAC.1